MSQRVKHFKTLAGYKKNEAFQHIHGVAPTHAPYSKILIGGKLHKVMHAKYKRS